MTDDERGYVADGAIIGWCDNGNTRGEFTASLARLSGYSTARGLVTGINRMSSGPDLVRGRTGLTRGFLKSPAQWLLTVDSDMTFRHDALEKLLDVADPKDRPVVGGLTFGFKHDGGPFPVMYRQVATKDGYAHTPIWDFPDDDVIEVDAIGGAFILIHRTVFETIDQGEPFPYYGHYVVPNLQGVPVAQGEDLSWCLRLKEHDIPIHVHTGVRTGHIKSFEWNTKTYEANRDAFTSTVRVQAEEADRIRREDPIGASAAH